MPKTASERFHAKLAPPDENGCVEFTGCTGNVPSGNHGQFWSGTRLMGAHRWAWEHYVAPIPDGLFVLHKCDNPPCCNTSHLFIGTQADNLRDMHDKGRGINTRKTHCVNGHPFSGSNLRIVEEKGGGKRRRCVTCANEKNRAWRARQEP